MKRIVLFLAGFLLVYVLSVIAINLPQKPQEKQEVVNIQPQDASPSAQIEVPSVVPNL